LFGQLCCRVAATSLCSLRPKRSLAQAILEVFRLQPTRSDRERAVAGGRQTGYPNGNTIGSEEVVNVSVYVSKIHPEKFKERIDKSQKMTLSPVQEDKQDKDDKGDGPVVPFQGYKS